MKRTVITLVLVVGRLAPAQLPTPTAASKAFAHRIAGCYLLDDGAWRADSIRVGDISTKYAPLSFQLTDQLLHGWNSLQSSALPMFTARAPSESFTFWRRMSSSSLHILVSRPLPMAGVQLFLTPHGRDLTGSVMAFTDALEEGKPSEITRPVYARRVSCINWRVEKHKTR